MSLPITVRKPAACYGPTCGLGGICCGYDQLMGTPGVCVTGPICP